MRAIREDIVIEQGADFSKGFQVNDADGNPFDLTGAQGRAQVRKTYSDKKVLLEFDIDIDGPLGQIFMRADAVQTSELPVLKAKSYEKALTSYTWDLELVLPDERTIRLFEGVVKVSPEVTR